jgi:hypothetical protein
MRGDPLLLPLLQRGSGLLLPDDDEMKTVDEDG